MSTNTTRLEDLAKMAGVSISTVSRALNDHPLISLATKKKVWALAREHHYPFRSYMPAAPVGSEGSIVVVTPHMQGRPLPLSHPFFLELLASIGEAARARDCDFTVSHTAPRDFDDLMTVLNSSRASGVIFLGQSMLHDDFNRLAETNSNFVVWGAHLPGQKYPSVGSDNVMGGRRATLHLARLERKAIAFVGSSDPEAMQRRQGYLEALEANGLAADPALDIRVDFGFESAERALSQFLARGRQEADLDKGYAGYALAPETTPHFWVMLPLNGEPATVGNGVTIAFEAPDRPAVDRFHAAALAHGGTDEGAPGLRPHYHPDYYGAYVRDPDGNKLCCVCHRPA